MDRIKALASQLTGNAAPPHPFDPLSATEIEAAVAIVRKEKGDHLFFNTVALKDPPKKQMQVWLADPSSPRPARIADVVAVATGSKVYDAFVDLNIGKIIHWELLDGFQPIVSETPL